MTVGTRTAPTVDDIPAYKLLAIRYIDFTGDKRSVSVPIDVAATAVQIEALIAASVLGSNASIYEVRVSDVYPGVPLAGNAIEEVFENVKDNIVLQFKDVLLDLSVRNYMPSPVNEWFIDGTDNIDTANAEFIAWKAATDVVLATDLFPIGVRFTPRKDNNPSTPL